MELKVWCDGIQRIVCGATSATTCQDVVFALAHATGQTGRFILIEKWNNNERILAPTDYPIQSISKWGEYSNDVIFVLKKSGDLSPGSSTNTNNHHHNNNRHHHHHPTINRQPTPKLSKKSESDLFKNRKRSINLENGHHHQTTKSMSTLENQSSQQQQQQLFQNVINNQPNYHHLEDKEEEKLEKSISSHHQNNEYLSLTRDNRNTNHHHHSHQRRPSYHNHQQQQQRLSSHNQMESLYGTLSRTINNRPRKPPPYQEAIAKSSLMNNGVIMFQQQPQENGQHHQQLSSEDHHHNSITTTTTKNSSQPSISLVRIHSKRPNEMKQNDHIVVDHGDNREDDELDELKTKWMEQELLIKQLESEQMEQELEHLIQDGHHYSTEINEIKIKLADCENEISRRRDEILKLMNKIDNQFQNQKYSDDNQHQQHSNTMIERLKLSVQEKNDKIHNQQTDLTVMNESLKHFDQTLQMKNRIVDDLIEQIKEANVEGLELQNRVGLTTTSMISFQDGHEEQQQQINDNGSNNIRDNNQTIKSPPPPSSSLLSSATNRKIPVSLHELGNTVPTKRNPDGIWV
ncbi:uncharacterized protein LOC113793878 isoform X1 [Dermatophagoides pteronyssinus]|uniref:uncharacterized protein LOC113793878 isoform X1 n=1 Tax=Dermatophagoides pteronyssinus TaxID=6956 RepID=UPI003F6800C9